MVRVANRFTNPATGAIYDWEINHNEEDESGRERAFSFEANTGNVGLVKQQGELQPLVLRYTGRILTKAQLDQMLAWYLLCETQSIYFTDYAGDSYEVTISSFKPKRQRAARNPRGGTAAPMWTWSYTIELVVLRVLAGSYVGFPA